MTSQTTAMTINRVPGTMVPAMVPMLEMRPEAFMPKKLAKVAPQNTTSITTTMNSLFSSRSGMKI